MKYKYSTKNYEKENMARVAGRSLAISTKFSIEVCNFIRNKTTSEAKEILQKVVEGKKAIPFKIFNRELSHKRKIGPGRYPKKTAIAIINLLESVEANAQFKGLNTSVLRITHINAHLASRPWRYGRQRRRKAKRTHLEIIVEEKKTEEKKIKEKTEKKIQEKPKEKQKEAPKAEEKPKIEEKKKEAPKIEKTKEEKPKAEPKEEASKAEKKQEIPKIVKKAEEGKND
jgi:large subunit ribosomal protein L22